ncbi:MAG: hypothetical protein IKO19_04880 [Candidatus Riflebacteria bacterium]|nr:hypothetical protein [Candidatus Riflebacteria bacterium]
MRRITLRKILICFLAIILIANPLFACDDTLVMLLTAKNPTSEFSKSIRNFMNSLTLLGTALKYTPKDSYDTEVEGMLSAWMEFSKKYMTNPPEEAKNDLHWVEKMNDTAKKIGEIRKLVNNKEFLKAHNGVLELSNTIGTFFEAVGITDEKQVFITVSANLNDLQRLVESKLYKESKEKLVSIQKDLDNLKKYTSEDDISSASNTAMLINTVNQALESNQPSEEIDITVSKLRTSFEELRSRILMQEWFSEDDSQKEGM